MEGGIYREKKVKEGKISEKKCVTFIRKGNNFTLWSVLKW